MDHNTQNQNQKSAGSGRKVTSKQIVAMVGIVLLVLMYLITLAAALFGDPSSDRLFQTCFLATMVIPILIWIYAWLYGRLTGKHTPGDPAPGPAEAEKSGDSGPETF